MRIVRDLVTDPAAKRPSSMAVSACAEYSSYFNFDCRRLNILHLTARLN